MTEKQTLFVINNLQCSYNGSDVVLDIDELIIPRGKLIAILGVSGAGKSTILETLGLMNKTFVNGSKISFHDRNEQVFNYERLWNDKNQLDIEKIRRDHFSFIFQETNLMQNFTAYENVCLSQMLQGITKSEAFSKASQSMKDIGLSEIDADQKAYELSGGQRQRIAFVRAITPEYSVLFGDEPTGNLDEKSSFDLMAIIRDDVQKKNVSAIIVTHNIKLSAEFADIIMVITKQDKRGTLLKEHIYTAEIHNDKKAWTNTAGNSILNIVEQVRTLL